MAKATKTKAATTPKKVAHRKPHANSPAAPGNQQSQQSLASGILITEVRVRNYGNYLPFLRMAESFKIPWYIFSDGEPQAVTAVNAALEAIGQNQIPSNPRVVALPAGKDFEAYIVTNATKDTLITTIIQFEGKSPQHIQVLTSEWTAKSDAEKTSEVLDTLRAKKTQYGARIGKLLPVPALLEDLFKKVDTELGP